MSSLKSAPSGSGHGPAGAALVAIYTTAIFLSAALLFALQPMFTKMVLPALGGSPSIWSMAMVFFQALLLAGYAYAHAQATRLGRRRGALVHILILGLAAASLPIALRGADTPPAEANPSLWLIGVFTLSVGLPFFALSAHGPLLQAWFARSGHARAADPYFLYAASNIGSFAALLGYPLLVEPIVGLSMQAVGWSIGFLALTALIAGAGLLSGRAGDDQGAPPRDERSRIPTATKATWVAIGFAPSGLLVAVTAHVSTDIAAAPLIWVLPLGLYLLSFPLIFRTRPAISQGASLALLIWSAMAILLDMISSGGGGGGANAAASFLFHMTFLFASALVCHGALYRSRPQPAALTAFYVSLSLGGVLGGLFAGLAAPFLFSRMTEYPLLVMAALACAPGALAHLRKTPLRDVLLMILLSMGAIVALALALDKTPWPVWSRIGVCALAGLPLVLIARAPGRSALIGLALPLLLTLIDPFTPGESHRSFFGVTRIVESPDGAIRSMVHGRTQHGAVRVRNADGTPLRDAPKPLLYYTFAGPMGEAIAALRKTRGGLDHAAVVGLGVGALACHFRALERVVFYEIDSIVVQLATDKNRFPFLSGCPPQISTVLGDARLTLAQQKETSDVIVIDAFSSDAIPMHLLTSEALGLYLSKLAPHGAIIMHITNKYVELTDLVARIGAEHGLVTYMRKASASADEKDMPAGSQVAVLARSREDLRDLLDGDTHWRAVTPPASYPVWTDDHSTILTALTAKWR